MGENQAAQGIKSLRNRTILIGRGPGTPKRRIWRSANEGSNEERPGDR